MTKRRSVSYWYSNDGSDFMSQVLQISKRLEALANNLDVDMSMYYNNPSLEGPVIESDLEKIRGELEKIFQFRSVLNPQQKKCLNRLQDKLSSLTDPIESNFEHDLDDFIQSITDFKRSLGS